MWRQIWICHHIRHRGISARRYTPSRDVIFRLVVATRLPGVSTRRHTLSRDVSFRSVVATCDLKGLAER